jgi:hypothetical protein
MALDLTSGFDMLVQLSESELNTQLSAAFESGSSSVPIPHSLNRPFNILGASGNMIFNFVTPIVDLDQPPPNIRLRLPFINSQLEVTSPLAFTLSPLGGEIIIIDAIEMFRSGGTQQPVLNFTSDGASSSIAISFDTTSLALITPILPALGLTINQVESILADQVKSTLANDIRRLPLTPAIPVVDDDDPLTPFNIEVTTINDTSAADRDALVFGIQFGAASSGNINAVINNFIPDGQNSLVMMSNNWLLSQLIRPRMASGLGINIAMFDTPCHLNGSVPAPGGTGTLTNLDAFIEGNRIRVNGRATVSGTGWSGVATFTFFIDIAIVGGQMVITNTAPEINTSISLEWWVWLTTLGIGALLGGVIGGIVAIIVVEVIKSIVESVANNILGSRLTDSLPTIPPIPLGPIGAGLAMSSVVLDDLELRGSIIRSLSIPIKNTGKYETFGSFSLDLETGAIYNENSSMAGIDLSWNPTTGLTFKHNAACTITGYTYGSLTPTQIRTMSLNSTIIQRDLIPIHGKIIFIEFGSEMVLGVRTNQGRLAKIKLWIDPFRGNILDMEWVTYDTPIPTLDIALMWSVKELGKSLPPRITGSGEGIMICSDTEASFNCRIEAWPKLMAFPINYQWCIDGTILKEGDGVVKTSKGDLKYLLKGRFLKIESGMNQIVKSELCVSAIDHNNLELFTCVQLEHSGLQTSCQEKRFIPEPTYIFDPSDPEIYFGKWTQLNSPIFKERLKNAISVKQILK